MRVLILHNSYQFAGGEDRAVVSDRALLEARGHETRLYRRDYSEIAERSFLSDLSLAAQVVWSTPSYQEIRTLIGNWRPDIAHFHNIYPLISPSGYAACRAEGVPTVQTLHNYRLVCPAGTLLRDGKVCELCVGKVPWPAVRYACYRGSRPQSFVMASSLAGHTLRGTWHKDVGAYIALSEFGRRLFIKGGLPEDRIFIRSNAVDGVEPAAYTGPDSAVFVGRLSPEKGLSVLLDAWRNLPDVPLSIIGGGPLLDEVRARVDSDEFKHVEVTGELPHQRVLQRVRGAGMFVSPSIWYEGLGYAILEALSAGIPVIASDLGTQAEMVRDGVSGLVFTAGDAGALVNAVRRLRSSRDLAKRLARGARADFLTRYSVEESYARLVAVYERVVQSAGSSRADRQPSVNAS